MQSVRARKELPENWDQEVLDRGWGGRWKCHAPRVFARHTEHPGGKYSLALLWSRSQSGVGGSSGHFLPLRGRALFLTLFGGLPLTLTCQVGARLGGG